MNAADTTISLGATRILRRAGDSWNGAQVAVIARAKDGRFRCGLADRVWRALLRGMGAKVGQVRTFSAEELLPEELS